MLLPWSTSPQPPGACSTQTFAETLHGKTRIALGRRAAPCRGLVRRTQLRAVSLPKSNAQRSDAPTDTQQTAGAPNNATQAAMHQPSNSAYGVVPARGTTQTRVNQTNQPQHSSPKQRPQREIIYPRTSNRAPDLHNLRKGVLRSRHSQQQSSLGGATSEANSELRQQSRLTQPPQQEDIGAQRSSKQRPRRQYDPGRAFMRAGMPNGLWVLPLEARSEAPPAPPPVAPDDPAELLKVLQAMPPPRRKLVIFKAGGYIYSEMEQLIQNSGLSHVLRLTNLMRKANCVLAKPVWDNGRRVNLREHQSAAHKARVPFLLIDRLDAVQLVGAVRLLLIKRKTVVEAPGGRQQQQQQQQQVEEEEG